MIFYFDNIWHDWFKMNEIVNKFLLTGDKCMPELYLRQSGFTYSACWPFTIWDWWWNINNNICFHFKLFPGKTNENFFKKNQKTLFRGNFGPFFSKFGQKWISCKKGLKYSNYLPSNRETDGVSKNAFWYTFDFRWVFKGCELLIF